jgi:hypothetical protein
MMLAMLPKNWLAITDTIQNVTTCMGLNSVAQGMINSGKIQAGKPGMSPAMMPTVMAAAITVISVRSTV